MLNDLTGSTLGRFDFELVPGSPVQIVAEGHEHLVSQCMQEESKLIGQATSLLPGWGEVA